MDEVSKYFNKKYLEWQMESGELRTRAEYAEYLGVEPGTLGHWMNGARKPDLESVEQLSKKLGPKIFDIAGYLRPDPQLRRVVSIWHKLDERGKSVILGIVVEAANKEKAEQSTGYGSKTKISD